MSYQYLRVIAGETNICSESDSKVLINSEQHPLSKTIPLRVQQHFQGNTEQLWESPDLPILPLTYVRSRTRQEKWSRGGIPRQCPSVVLALPRVPLGSARVSAHADCNAGILIYASVSMEWYSSGLIPALFPGCHSLILLYPGHKHCIKSKLQPYFPYPLLFLFFFIISFSENGKKNVEKSRHWFIFWWKLEKPQACTSTPCCPLFDDPSGPDFWRHQDNHLCRAQQCALASWQGG